MIPRALLLSLFIRTVLTLPFPHTYFQPDEFYQALEIAHNYVFGYGYLTWEWKDLPSLATGGWYDIYVAGGRMRGWLWPGVFAGIYKLLDILNLDNTELIVIAPRLVGILVAALTDYYTYKLASKLISPGASSAAIFLSLTSLFNAHLLPRSLSTSPETLLTTMALCYFPFPELPFSKSSLQSMNSVHKERSETDTANLQDEKRQTDKLDYLSMDRERPLFTDVSCSENLPLSIILATTALCIRPTTISLWNYLGTDLVIRTSQSSGLCAGVRVIATAVLIIFATLAASTVVDYNFTGRLYFPALTFIYHNIIKNISSFYGSTNSLYHITQSIPIMLFPIWYWSLRGFVSSLLPAATLPTFETPGPLRLLSRAITFSIFILSLSPHSEWRFLHPLLPPLLIFAIPPLVAGHNPHIIGCYRLTQSIRQYTRIPKHPFYLILFAPIVPFLYLNIFHGAAQVEVMNILRRGQLGEVKSLVALTPCHSIPWQSHLHSEDMEGWFLTCEPPIGVNADIHRTQQDFFYQTPVTYLRDVFPYPPAQLHEIANITANPSKPTHIIVFGELLNRSGSIEDRTVTVQETLVGLEYEQVWSRWNGFDILQDEDERKGGLQVWRLVT
ncbi:uncharacterized protein I206_100885 [Kwoniella pini CBS 10737]|uniref:Mannosyltransferase n=1 Tax=Kwoniella pini CBS 10737 TaxID=1296096 RepID=A0A1B9ICR4_9TREE|nr:uncharacterized protein I206_00441 [Kwoniella pini CBS 10737]OCF53140.1 hypothetical protein I206_00441 [Kwoniella pini CBS 10737]